MSADLFSSHARGASTTPPPDGADGPTLARLHSPPRLSTAPDARQHRRPVRLRSTAAVHFNSDPGAVPDAWEDAKTVGPSQLSIAQLSSLTRDLGVEIPPGFEYLLLRYGTTSQWETPLLSFPAFGRDDAFDQFRSMVEMTSHPRLFPIGFEHEEFGLGQYCLDYRSGHVAGSIVYDPHLSERHHRDPSPPLVSSFDKFIKLSVMILRGIATDGVAPAPRTMRALDGVFSEAWERWWKIRF